MRIELLVVLVFVGALSMTSQVYARNITAFVHFNEDILKEDDGYGELAHGAFYTVNGNIVSNWHHDMIEALYPDEANKGPLYDYVSEDELTVPDNTTEICYEDADQPGYRACNEINNNTTEIHFSYPASWNIDDDED